VIEPPHPFDLAATIDSGQVFHWSTGGGSGRFYGMIGAMPAVVEQAAPGRPVLVWEGDPPVVHRYFGLDADIESICATFPSDDPHLEAAIRFCPGLRIIRQPRWECLATFITSSLKNIPAIRRMSLALRARFGGPAVRDGAAVVPAAYPGPAVLARAGEEALRECGLGYRAKSLAVTAEMVASGRVDLESVGRLDDDAARAALCRCRGVGEKVANCVLLFAFGRLGAFPVDVWVERVLRELYFRRKRNVTAGRIRDFADGHFGPHRGYAQQFLFHYARKTFTKERGFRHVGDD
jgi:N-glycosylase/DNA lyase